MSVTDEPRQETLEQSLIRAQDEMVGYFSNALYEQRLQREARAEMRTRLGSQGRRLGDDPLSNEILDIYIEQQNSPGDEQRTERLKKLLLLQAYYLAGRPREQAGPKPASLNP